MIAVSAWFDEQAEAAVRALWRRLADAGVDDSLADGPYRPHVTLGVWETVPVEEAAARLRTTQVRQLQLTFRAIGIYPGRGAGVYLTPTVTAELRKLHEHVHARLAELGAAPEERHVPGRWEPHCTVAWRLERSRMAAALDVVLDAGILPLEATVTRIGIIDTPAEIELECLPLS